MNYQIITLTDEEIINEDVWSAFDNKCGNSLHSEEECIAIQLRAEMGGGVPLLDWLEKWQEKFEKTGKRFSYPLSQVLADKQAVGRVVLMGNAAHTIHPVAGQGFNLCLRDADVLVRYLMEQLAKSDDIGNPDNLLAYEQARLTDQQRVIKFCDSVVRGFSNQNPILKLLRNTGLIAFDVIPGIKPLVANYAMGLKA